MMFCSLKLRNSDAQKVATFRSTWLAFLPFAQGINMKTRPYDEGIGAT
jgi:hypothetical protein